MDVQTRPRVFFEWFCHEAGDKTMLTCNCLDCSFQQNTVIAGEYRVVDMFEIDFKLPGRKFGNCGTHGDVLRNAGIVQVIEKVFDVPEIVGVIHLRAGLRAADARHPGHTLRWAVRLCVEQIKLELCRHDD